MDWARQDRSWQPGRRVVRGTRCVKSSGWRRARDPATSSSQAFPQAGFILPGPPRPPWQLPQPPALPARAAWSRVWPRARGGRGGGRAQPKGYRERGWAPLTTANTRTRGALHETTSDCDERWTVARQRRRPALPAWGGGPENTPEARRDPTPDGGMRPAFSLRLEQSPPCPLGSQAGADEYAVVLVGFFSLADL